MAPLLMWLHLCLRWFRGYFSFVELLSCPWNSEKVVGPEFCLQGMGDKAASLPWSPAGPRSGSIPHKLPSSPSENNCGFPACS